MATYRKAVFSQSGLAVTVLVINAVFLVVAGFKFSLLDEEGVGTMFTGSCDVVHKADVGIHFLLNVLSTALLSASNYCMQCLSAPTREDIDKAHAERRPMDIGIHSMTNLLYVPRRRLVAWIILVLTSVPLHLMYNSVVFQTSAANLLTVALVSEEFIGNTSPAINNLRAPWPWDVDAEEIQDKLAGYARDSVSWINMTNAECIHQYTRGYVTKYSNLLLVSKTYNQSELFYQLNIHNPTVVRTHSWMCDWGKDAVDGYDTTNCKADSPVDPDNWSLREFIGDRDDRQRDVMRREGMTEDEIDMASPSLFQGLERREYNISYCMAQPITEICKLQYSQTILAVVTLMNSLKAACMLYIAFFGTNRDPLVIIGDAIASFMECEDIRTSELCAAPLAVVNDPNSWETGIHTQARRLGNYPRRWINSPSLARWIITILFCVIVIFASGLLIIPGTRGLLAKKTPSEIWSTGLGQVDVNSLLNVPFFNTQLRNVILSNTPQLVLSILYLLYNSLFTVMLSNLEWITYAIKRSHLRVSFPRKGQLSSLRLQIPYRYGIPLLTLSLLLHWLVSQSIFVAQIEILVGEDTYIPTDESPFYASKVVKSLMSTGITSSDGRRIFAVIKTCGYSVIGIIFSLTVGLLALIVALCMGWFSRYPGRMQLGATCSAVIIAACHSYRPIDKFDGMFKRLRWGEAEEVSRISATRAGHLTFLAER